MPTFALTISPPALAELVHAICALYNYQDTVDGAPNPESRQAFTKRLIAEDLKQKVRNHRLHLAVVAAQAEVSAVEPDIA